MSKTLQGLSLAASVLALGGCGGHHLADYDFRNRSIAVVQFEPPSPSVWTGNHSVGGGGVLISAIEAGTAVAVHFSARDAQARLDSAARNVDMSDRLARETLMRAARYLGARPVDDEAAADYVLEIDVQSFGINASGGAATLYVEGEAILIDGASGREIWNREVEAWDQVSPNVEIVGGPNVSGVLTAATLARMTVEDYELVLQQLADYAADAMTQELREDLRDARDD